MQPDVVDTRSELLSLLTEAAELEHGLACAYLYAAFSMRQEISEGLSWEEQQIAKRWAAQIYFVASQEMLHLAQVWNLLTSIGGAPYYLRPNLPQSKKYYPLSLPLELLPFSARTMETFIQFEHPRDVQAPLPTGPEFRYNTIGQLYSLIRSGFMRMDASELFIGARSGQATSEVVHFPDIIPVYDRASALRAIDRITEQGEGANVNVRDCHFAIFCQIRDELNSRPFNAVRPSLANPVARRRPEQAEDQVNEIRHPYSRAVAEFFDDVYAHMLRMLSDAFERPGEPKLAQLFSQIAIEMMVTCVKPLGEALTLLPANNEGGTAGAPFSLSRHLSLPTDGLVAWTLAKERLDVLSATAGALVASYPMELDIVPSPQERLKRVHEVLTRTASRLARFQRGADA